MSQFDPGKTTTPTRTIRPDPAPAESAATAAVDEVAPRSSTAYASMSGLLSSSPASRSTIARAVGLVDGLDGQLDPPADPHGGDAGHAEMGQALLDRPALRVEDARLGRDVDREAECRSGAHRAMTSSSR